MNNAADLHEDDEFDRMVGSIVEAAGGDAQAAILDLARRQQELQCVVDRCVSAGHARRLQSA